MAAYLWLIVASCLVPLAPVAAQPVAASPFQPCADAASDPALADSLCTRHRSALDPSGQAIGIDGAASIDLFIRKFPPAGGVQQRGAIWLIAGGPGESGASFYPIIATMRRAFPSFALIVPDHRGTGYSSRLCPVEEAPDSPGGSDLSGQEWASCPQSMFAAPGRAQAFTVTNAAYDLSQLITRFRGTDPTHIYAVSYGTQLVLRMMLVAPVQADSLILDGLVPLEGSVEADLGRRTAITDSVGRSLLDADRQAAYRSVLMRTDAPWQGGAASADDVRLTMASLLAFPQTRAAIPTIVDGLSANDLGPLTRTMAQRDALVSGFDRFAQSSLSLPLVMMISGSENNDRRDITAAMVEKENADALFVSPLPALLPRIAAPLYPRDRFYGMIPATLPPTLVIQGTLDPNTPYDAAVRHIDRLKHSGSVTLASVEGGSHFLALTAPDCFVESVSAFIDGSRVEDCVVP